jgi:hypothetical protein
MLKGGEQTSEDWPIFEIYKEVSFCNSITLDLA